METNNMALVAAQKKGPTIAQKAKTLAAKAGTVVFGSLVSASAFAQSADLPTDLAGAAQFMRDKGLIAIGVAAAITLIILGLTGAKLPRRAS